MDILRTPDNAFTLLPDFPYQPHYLEIDDPDVGSLRVHYIDEGPKEAPVILCLHGQATWSYLYRHMIPHFAEAGYRVIVPDYVGFGRSDKFADHNAYSSQRFVDWLAATLKGLNIEQATGFFFDWGGMFGLPVATDHPNMFDRLILLNTTLPRGNQIFANMWVLGWRAYCYRQKIFPQGEMVAKMTHYDVSAETITAFDAPYPDEGYKKGPLSLPNLIPASPWHQAVAMNKQTWQKLETWRKPVLTLFSESLAKRGLNPSEFQNRIPGASGQPHETIPDAGFFIVEDKPHLLADKTLTFIHATSQRGRHMSDQAPGGAPQGRPPMEKPPFDIPNPLAASRPLTDDEQIIQDALSRYAKAFIDKSHDDITQAVTDDFTLVQGGGAELTAAWNKQEFVNTQFKHMVDMFTGVKYDADVLSGQVDGHHATGMFRFAAGGNIHGRDVLMEGIGSVVLVKDGDAWRISHMHSSAQLHRK